MLNFKKLYTFSFAMLTLFFSSNNYAAPTQQFAITDFEINRYLGTWYEIARFPISFEKGCIAPTTAEYSVEAHDSDAMIIKNKCYKGNNQYSTIQGIAHFVDTRNVAELKVKFLPAFLRWLPIGTGGYWVLYTDYENYALVSDGSYDYLWLLSRSEILDTAKIKKILAVAKNQGFDIQKLEFNYPFKIAK
jgi:apolipoprotein D and lipocalin family protein